jgi:hypothetical protein
MPSAAAKLIALMTPAMRKNRAEGQFYIRDIVVGKQ